jgi:N-acyl-phosphatidylethanolamine-hydrolysing phospholipase D
VRRALAFLLAGAVSATGFDPATLHAPHRGPDGAFFNPWDPQVVRFWDALRWQLFSRNEFDKSKEPVIPVVPNDGRSLAEPNAPAELTWVGHATFAIHEGDDVVLTDPQWSQRALLPRRRVAPGIPLESVPSHAFAVISHNHYDHLDAETVERLPASVGWYVPLGMAGFFRERGREDVTELDWWQSARRGRWTITCLPSQHWSRRLGYGRNETLWCAWLLDSGAHKYFFAGDSGYFGGFAEMGRTLGPIDVALLPIGGYEPRWFMRSQHMNPAEAVQTWRDLGAHTMLGMHWGTFDLTDEPLDEPPRALARAVAAAGADPERVRVLAIGETWRVPEK